jgi:hypothetical protein
LTRALIPAINDEFIQNENPRKFTEVISSTEN